MRFVKDAVGLLRSGMSNCDPTGKSNRDPTITEATFSRREFPNKEHPTAKPRGPCKGSQEAQAERPMGGVHVVVAEPAAA